MKTNVRCVVIAIFSITFLGFLPSPHAVFVPSASAQETTGTFQGAVHDATGAVIPGARITVSTPSLVGTKTTKTDGRGEFHIANLPPGAYTVVVEAPGFDTLKRAGVQLEVGRTPTLDLALSVGKEATVVEVTSAEPAIDVTSVTSSTNVTSDVLNNVPRGRSFQSVIQFAPSARNEPLMGNTTTNGSGSVSPGNGSNGGAFGYSIAGASDSENSYLVEGQETANLIGGFSHTNVPGDFIQEVKITTSGVQAEFGGALGGVVNVIMKKGSPQYHGSLFTQYESQGLDAAPNAFSRYDPLSSGTPTSWGLLDPAYQNYQPIKDHFSDEFPGGSLSGPLVPYGGFRDKLFFFLSFNPEYHLDERFVNYGPSGGGEQPFSQNTHTFYSTARVDASVSSRVRVFGSWLYQQQRQYGSVLPYQDSTQGYYNLSSAVPTFAYSHSLGYEAPNLTVNTGADITITNSLVSTTRFGYYFENYHDYGYPTTGNLYSFQTSGLGQTSATGQTLAGTPLSQSTGYINDAYDQNFTSFNSNKAIQLDQDIAYFKSGLAGTHNFKFGYQLNRLSNILDQHWNEPYVEVYPGFSSATAYSPVTSTGVANCANYVALYGQCQGQYGYVIVQDFGSAGKAISYNHGLYAQDSWTIAKGLTADIGIRFDKEFLPGEATGNGAPAEPINFNWTDKVAPRLGAAWDVLRNGKLKVFADYGVFYDIMKLNLAISSFGGQYWQNCYYALNTPNLSSINVKFNSSNRYCTGADPNASTNFNGTGVVPAGLTFLESQNFRSFPTSCSTCSAYQEGVAPGLQPYRQHESTAGIDYQLSKTLAFEARYDRRRLDHVIEDASLASSATGSETFVVVNPGQGVNATFLGFCNFLYGNGAPDCQSSSGAYPPNQTIPAARSYDGVEFRLNKTLSHHYAGLFSYTYSRLRGNYTGLTSSDIADGGNGGRNAPNNSRAFDEPYFSYNADGGSSSGLLPTDRPNVFKGYVYYILPEKRAFTSNFGIFQVAYSGSPNTTYSDIGYGANEFPVDLFNRGKWANVTQDPSTGLVTFGAPYTYRNPWYTQTDFNFNQVYNFKEGKSISFGATFTNLLNQHSVTAVTEQLDSAYSSGSNFPTPGGLITFDGAAFYAVAEHPYNVAQAFNTSTFTGQPVTINSQYGKPLYYQLPRTIRLQFNLSF